HVDDDHIQGILELTGELREARNEKRPQFAQILSLWHNSFDNIIAHNTGDLTGSVKNQFGPASVSGSGGFSQDQEIEIEQDSDEDPEVVASGLKVLASIQQGAQLRQDAKILGIPINEEFGGEDELIVAKGHADALPMGEELTFSVAGPMLPEV